MGIYEVDYNLQVSEQLPVNKRLPIYIEWVKALVGPMVWLRDVIFNVFKGGVEYPEYTAGTYAKGDRVKYQKGIYESLVDSNTDLPTTSNWILIVDNFIGVNERVLFRSEKIIFEYALNKWFNTDAYPCVWSNIAGDSTIYITNNEISTGFFRAGTNQDLSSAVYFGDFGQPISNDGGATSIQYAYTINVPEDVYDSLGATDEIRDYTIRNFADKYNTVGLFYNIVTY